MKEKEKQSGRELDTEGGFNPDRPARIKTHTVGPLPTDDPKGKAKPDLRKALENEADRSEK